MPPCAHAGQFDVEDLDLAVTTTAAALLALGQLFDDDRDRDDEETTDRVTEGLRGCSAHRQPGGEISRSRLPDVGSPRNGPPDGPLTTAGDSTTRVGANQLSMK